jgi:hypothetical protein
VALSDGDHRHQTGRLWEEELPHSVLPRLSRGDRAETRWHWVSVLALKTYAPERPGMRHMTRDKGQKNLSKCDAPHTLLLR